MPPSPIPEILDELRQGRMIILVDDPSRENEGDIAMLAEHVTPEAVNFMAREARGLICLPMCGTVCDRLGLRPQVELGGLCPPRPLLSQRTPRLHAGGYTGCGAPDPRAPS